MASKPDKMNKTMCLLSLFGLFAGVLLCSYSYGFQKYLEPRNRDHFVEDIGEFNSIRAHNLYRYGLPFLNTISNGPEFPKFFCLNSRE
jgi:hypothetical protein